MNKIYLTFLLTLLAIGWGYAQYPLVTIQQIQQVSNGDILAGRDTSSLYGDTVRVRGVVVTPPGSGVSSSTNGRWIWIQDGNGPWSGLNVRKNNGNATFPQDMLFAVPGDSVEIVGVLNAFSNEDQLDPLDSGFQVLGSSAVTYHSTSDLSDFANPNADPATVDGEPWEGQFVEFTNVTVVSVQATSSDIRFRVQDGSGNEVEVYDTYTVQQPSTVSCTNCIPYPPFTPPSVGDVFDTLRGIIDGRNFGTSPPYAIAPFDTTHYVYGASAPKIFNVFRDIQVPTSSQSVTITATITDNGGSVTGARLYYAIGETNTNYTQVTMSNPSGSTYTGTIPAGINNDMVKYYIEGDDNDGNTTTSPGGAPSSKTHFYFVKDNGTLSIRDVQYTPYSDGESGYKGETVTVGGVVSASAFQGAASLGTLYIQDRTFSMYGGIWVALGAINPNDYASMIRGDTVLITGVIEENFGVTRIVLDDANDFTVLGSVGNVQPMDADPDVFTSYSISEEGYESMLLRLVPNGVGTDSLYVASANADDPSDFGEWRAGHDKFDPNTGSRVLVGRSQGSNNFSYTTSRSDLVVNVPQQIVAQGDRFHDLTGIMYYSFGNWKLLPRNNGDISDYNGNPPIVGLQASTQDGVAVFPNPTSGFTMIRLAEKPDHGASYLLVDILGQELTSGSINNREVEMDLRDLPSGQYILLISDPSRSSTSYHRLIKR